MVQLVTSKPPDVGTCVRISVKSHELGFFLTKKKKKMPNKWRTINSLVHKIRLHGRRGKGTAESCSREKSRHAPQKEDGEILCDPGWYVHKPDVQNKWDDNTHHTQHTVIGSRHLLRTIRVQQYILLRKYMCLKCYHPRISPVVSGSIHP